MGEESKEYFNIASKEEQDLIKTSKEFMKRQRLGREIRFDETFRKRFMLKEYGNYKKYENNGIQSETETGADDIGADLF